MEGETKGMEEEREEQREEPSEEQREEPSEEERKELSEEERKEPSEEERKEPSEEERKEEKEEKEEIIKEPSFKKNNIESKQYKIKLKDDTYYLTIEVISKGIFLFTIKQPNKDKFEKYDNEFSKEELISKLKLLKASYDDDKKIFKFFDFIASKNNLSIKPQPENDKMIVSIKRTLDIEDIECFLELKRANIKQDEIIKAIIEQTKEMQVKAINENNEKFQKEINDLKTKIDANDKKYNLIEKRLNDLINTNNNYKNEIQNLKAEIETIRNESKKQKDNYNQDIKNLKEKLESKIQNLEKSLANNNNNYQNQIQKLKEEIKNNNKNSRDQIQDLEKIIKNNIAQIDKLEKKIENYNNEKKNKDLEKKTNNNKDQNQNQNCKQINKQEKEKEKEEFKENPEKLEYVDIITNNHSSGGALYNFEVFKGLKDNTTYIIYNNKRNFNLEIMRIEDKKIIKSLEGHKNRTIVIRYYTRDNKEEYILTCDMNHLLIVWDINNSYKKKYIIEIRNSGYISDALLLFNVFKNDYILVSSDNRNEFSKLYLFKDNTPFKRNIEGTKENCTEFLIPWQYKNKYYIIECCYKKISINNILEDECYANLSKDPEGDHYCGYIYKDNYLCVSDNNNNFIRIWDLVKKEIYKEIKYDGNNGTEILPWNKYIIIGCTEGFVIINKEEGKTTKIIKTKNSKDICGIKKIKNMKLGESLFVSGSNNNIILYSIKDK